MKRPLLIIGLAALTYFVFIDTSEARDGKSGGGGHSGGHGGGAAPQQHAQSHAQSHSQAQRHAPAVRRSNSISQTPSMSRADRPHSTFQHQARTSHPSSHQVQEFLQIQPRPSPAHQFPSSGLPGRSGSGLVQHGIPGQLNTGLPGRPGSGLITPLDSQRQLHQFAQQSKLTRQNRPPAGQFPQGFQGGFSQQFKNNRQSAHRVETTIRQNRPWLFNSFNDNFFNSHNFHPFHHRHGANWWSCPGWGGVNSWLGWGWGSPVYYDDGYVYPDSSYTTPEEPPAPPQQVAPPESTYTWPEETEQSGNWLPLGVFITGQNSSQVSFSNTVMQLALNKQGEISGTYYNTATDKTYQIEGLVDKESQEAVWRLSQDPSSPIMSTGIYNLTQDQSTVQVTFPDGVVQTWVLVRLNAETS